MANATAPVIQINEGNVGIGTTNPGAKLEVAGTIKSIGTAPKLLISNTKNGTWTPGESLGLLEWYGADASGGGPKVQSSIDVVAQDQYGAHFNMLFKLSSGSGGNTELMRIKGTGEVGIGTDNPDSNLEVAGDTGSNTVLHVRNDSTGSTRLKLSNSTDTNANGFQIINNALNGSVNLLNYKATTLALWTNSSQRMTILSGGDVGIGTTNPQAQLNVVAGSTVRTWTPASGTSAIFESSNTSRAFVSIVGANQSELLFGDAGSQFSGRVRYDHIDDKLSLWASGSQDVTVDNSGNVGINTASPNSQSKLHITTQNYNTGCRIDGPTGQTFGLMTFYAGGSYRGAISPTSTGVNYISASDYRLKENVIKLQNSTERIKKLKPSNFNFLENPSETVDGFIAHELQEIVPEAVTGKKDAVGFDGEPNYQGVDQSKIVPLLTAALQEAISKIEQLETRIQILENK